MNNYFAKLSIALLLFLFLGATIAMSNTTNSISFGEIQPGRIPGAVQTNFYTFAATSNDVVSVALLRTNGTVTPCVYLYDPSGNLVFELCSGPIAAEAGRRLTKTGTYVFAVISSDLISTYDYLLSLTKVASGVNQREAGDGSEGMVPGQITSGHISPADMDTFTFTATSNDVITVELLRTNGTGVPYLFLYDPNGTLVFGDNENSSLAVVAGQRLTKTGTYTFVVIDSLWAGTYDYLLSLTKVAGGVNQREAGDGAEGMALGQITSGHISPADMDTFTFTATSNDVITVELLRTNGTGAPYLYLYDPNGTLVFGDNENSSLAVVAGQRLTKTGTYTFVVIDSLWAGTYDYLLSLTKVAGGVNQREAGDGAEGMAPGQITSGHISPADMDTFTFTATSNDVITVELLRTNGTGAPYLYLYDPNGTLVFGDNENSSLAVVAGQRLTKTGTYTFVVIDSLWAGTYDYLLSLTKVAGGVNQREAGDGSEGMVPGQITSGHISPADMDTFTFTATSNDVITVELLRTNGTGAPYLYLYDPNGTLVFGDNENSSLAVVAGQRLTKTGTYTFVVIDSLWAGTYDYLLSLTKVAGGVNQREAGDGAEGMVPGQITSGHISPADMDTFTFTATSNDVITVELLRTNGTGAPYLYLYDPNGTLVFGDNENSSLAVVAGQRLTKTGTYTFVVIDSLWAGTYDYLLSLTKVAGGVNQREAGDGAEGMAPGQITSGHISPADMDTFTFTATSNDVITVELLRTNGTGAPYLYLYDPNGTLVFGDNENSSLAVVAGQRLTKTGTYTFVVIDSLWAGTYDYNLCMIKNPGPNFSDPGDGPYTIAPYETRSAQITLGDLDAYAFHAIAGDTLTVQLRRISGPGMNPVVQLHAPDGTILASASSATSARIHVPCVSQTGTYLIVVFDNGWNEAFAYDVTLSQSPIVPASSGTNQYLAIYECTNHVIVRWETNAFGFSLESTLALPPLSWLPVNRVPQIIADHYYVDDGLATNSSKFYRLKCTNCVTSDFSP